MKAVRLRFRGFFHKMTVMCSGVFWGITGRDANLFKQREIWSVDFQQNRCNCCHQIMSDLNSISTEALPRP